MYKICEDTSLGVLLSEEELWSTLKGEPSCFGQARLQAAWVGIAGSRKKAPPLAYVVNPRKAILTFMKDFCNVILSVAKSLLLNVPHFLYIWKPRKLVFASGYILYKST
jgi:hypothetical protein